jgi:hypothetical protein
MAVSIRRRHATAGAACQVPATAARVGAYLDAAAYVKECVMIRICPPHALGGVFPRPAP